MDTNMADEAVSKSKNALYKQKYNKKQRELKEGTYQPSIFDQAKELLKHLQNPSLEILGKDARFDNLTDEELVKLKTFIKNMKAKEKSQQQQQNQDQENIGLDEEAKRIKNQQIPIVHQTLVGLPKEDINDALRKLLDVNPWLLIEYIEQNQGQVIDFLPNIIELYQELDEQFAPKLFIRVCSAHHQGQTIQVTFNMISQGLKFLLDDKHDDQAAFGLLRLAFNSNIHFTSIPIKQLIEFQNRYERSIINFFKIIPLDRSPFGQALQTSLPPTCFIFTQPLLSILKDGGGVLYQRIPLDVLPYIIRILGFSFENNKERFSFFLKQIKTIFSELQERLFPEIIKLLPQILIKTFERDENFFQNLGHSTNALWKAFTLLKEKKIEIMNEQIINTLLSSDEEQYEMLKKKPQVIRNFTEKNNQLKYILKINSELDENIFKESIFKERQIFQMMGIDMLSPMQEFCIQYCLSQKKNNISFMQLDIGGGKTCICLGIAILRAQLNQKVFILNRSEFLAWRDYKKSSQIAIKLNLKTCYIGSFEEIDLMMNNDIIYLTCQMLEKLVSTQSIELQNSILVMDEFDSIIFDQEFMKPSNQKAIQKFKEVFAVTGSLLRQEHHQLLKELFNCQVLNFSQNKIDAIKIQCHGINIHHTFKDYKDNIIQEVAKQSFKTPVIIICNQNRKQIKNALMNQKQHSIDLGDESAEKISSLLECFIDKSEGRYSAYILDGQQGRGFDFSTNSQIEDQGGVYLIIACLPENLREYQQYLGRTGRMNNKGQYSVILFDRSANNLNGQNYLKAKLDELLNIDQRQMNILRSHFSSQSKVNRERKLSILSEEDLLERNDDKNENQNKMDFSQNVIEEVKCKDQQHQKKQNQYLDEDNPHHLENNDHLEIQKKQDLKQDKNFKKDELSCNNKNFESSQIRIENRRITVNPNGKRTASRAHEFSSLIQDINENDDTPQHRYNNQQEDSEHSFVNMYKNQKLSEIVKSYKKSKSEQVENNSMQNQTIKKRNSKKQAKEVIKSNRTLRSGGQKNEKITEDN